MKKNEQKVDIINEMNFSRETSPRTNFNLINFVVLIYVDKCR